MLTLDPDELNRKFLQSNVSETVINSCLDISVSKNRDISFSFMCVSSCNVLDSVLNIKSSAVIQDNVHPKFIKIILPKLINTLTYHCGR